ncbi:DinB family protein [Tellurirhabdus rosea]|uniref:DinB family protein n=1 Tax=Tellurirhabdus rosea TaxID=2674997 RepID=UPI0022567076|nr:DinB family protein [Tellurirhabdus rosea]
MTPVQTPVALIPMWQKELELEAETTRKMLERVPDDKFDWQPHPKSMTIRQLATHIAELPTWVPLAINTEELDFAVYEYKPVPINNRAELLAYFEQALDEGREALRTVAEEQLELPWTLRQGDQIFSTSTKAETIRHAFSQIIHHRAQLGVFLRLLDIPIPGSYGPSADEQ